MQEQKEKTLDVVPGYGKGHNPGNQHLIQLVKDNLVAYNKGDKKVKGHIAALIVSAVQATGGRFLAEDNGYLVEMTNAEAEVKTKMRFDRLNHQLNKAAKKATGTTVSDATNTAAVAVVASNPAIIPGAETKTPNEGTDEAVRAPSPNLKSGIKKVAFSDSKDAQLPAAGMETPNEAETTSNVHDFMDIFDSDITEWVDALDSSDDADLPAVFYPDNPEEAGSTCHSLSLEDYEVASKSICDRSAMTPVLTAANLKFDQQRDMHKMKFVPRLKVKEDRTYMGSVMENVPHGRGVMTYKDGRVVSGDWVQGALQGQATIYYKGNGSYIGTFWHSKRVGYGVRHYADGSKYVGQYVDDKQNLKGIFTSADGSSLNGDFKDGKVEGIATKTSSDGKTKTSGLYKNGVLVEKLSLEIRKRWIGNVAGSNLKAKRRKTKTSETIPE